jgi:hypothetical protein
MEAIGDQIGDNIILTQSAGDYVCKLVYISEEQYKILTYKAGRHIETHRIYGDLGHAEAAFAEERYVRTHE